MATINFNSTITKVDSSNLTLNNSYYIGLAVKTSHNDHLINTKTLSDYTIPNSYAYAGLIYNTAKSYAINSTTAFSTSTFADGVYRATISESYDDGNTYESTAYQLLMYATDARWASFQENYDPANPSNLAIFNNVTTAYADIATLSANLAANYTTINTKITYINTQLDSAIFNITVNVSLSSATTLLASTTFYNGGISTDVADFIVDNLTTNQTKVYNATPELTIETTGTKSKSFVSGSPIGSPNYNDGVLEVAVYYHEENGTWEWTSVSYVLVTTAIDASIASLDTTILVNVCKKRALEYYRDLLQAAFDAADYTLCTDYFNAINTMLLGVQQPFEGTLSLVDNNTLSIVVPSVGNTNLFYQTSQLWNTYTQVLADSVEVTNQFLIPSGSGSLSIDSSDTLSLPIYSDGVYLFETYCVCQDGVDFDSNPTFASVVTTTIDAEFAIFEANYDPDNAAQAASYTAMLNAYAQIATLSSNVLANYADINDQIAIIQSNLALWVEVDMNLVLTNKSTMTLTINSTLPNVVYSEQSLTLNNTNDDSQEYTITTFPENYIDLTKTFSSSAINFGSQYDDAVYKVNLSWTADNGMEFSGVAYCLVMTQVNCGIAQIIAERPNCKQLQSKLNYLMTFREMAIDSYSNADYSTCNFYINKCIVILNQSGCGCGCN